MQILIIILGIAILFFGRKLFWLYVAAVGFLVGAELIKIVSPSEPQWVLITGGLAAGLIGSVLALFFQRVAFGLAGFFAGAYLGVLVVQTTGLGGGNSIIGFAVGGLGGTVAALLLMNWAIIIFSSLVGAGAILTQLPLGPRALALVFVALVIIGIMVQTRFMPRLKEN
jgi:uncharacterized membrane protein YccC